MHPCILQSTAIRCRTQKSCWKIHIESRMEWLRSKLNFLWPEDLPDEPYIKYQFDNFRLVGIYPGFKKAPYWQRLKLYAIELFCVLQTTAIACDLLDSREDIERFGDNMCILTALIAVLAKRWFCQFYVDDLIKFVEQHCVGFELYRYREQQFVQQLLSYYRLESVIVYTARILGTLIFAGLIFHGLLSDGFILRAKYPFQADTFIGYGVVFCLGTK
ncbi:uncharacterized protein LOC118464614 [Anopheles albimanus]|uniref:uncharacterized protein LOC118464614 n=1 Tax=Anopheles albimanus TaxID=7167 RepID=UPI001641A36C|nr:uncharacterized protein LOC118464614 [Anopheles albimanus]